MGQLKQLASQTVVYGASSVLGRLINFFLVPLYTSVFETGEYGVVTELYAFIAFLNVLYVYGLETAYFRFATKSDDPTRFFNTAQTSIILSSISLSGLLILFSSDIALILEYPGKEQFIICLALILGIDAIVAIPFARLRLEGKSLRFATFKLTNIGLVIGLNFFFLVFCPWYLSHYESGFIDAIYSPMVGVGYVFISNLIANGVYLLFFAPWFIRLRLQLGAEWKVMLAYAAPLMIMGFAGVTNEMLSRVLLKYWLPVGFYPQFTNQEIVGIFGGCYKLSVFMTLAIQAFRYAFEPFFFNKSADKQSPKLFAKVMHGFIIFASFSWLFISLFLDDLAPYVLRKEEYLFALDIVPWLLGGGLFLGIYFNLSVWYKLTDQTKFGAWITTAGAVLTLALNFLLIPIMGFMGSAVATFITYFLMVAVSFYLGQKRYYIPYYTARGLLYVSLAGLSILAFCLMPYPDIRYWVAFCLMMIFASLVWLLDIRRGTFK